MAQWGEEMELLAVRVPSGTISPDVPFNIEVDVRNNVSDADPREVFDPDQCSDSATTCDRGAFSTTGYCVEVTAQIVGANTTPTSFTSCHHTGILPPQDKTVELTLRAPEESGQYNVRVQCILDGTGNASRFLNVPIQVDVREPVNGGDGVNGGGGDGGDGDGFDVTQFFLENPGKAVLAAGAGLVIVRTATETAIQGDE